MVKVYSEIEINSPPARVREVLFDFAKLPQWTTNSNIKSITPIPETKAPFELQSGDKLKVSLGGMSFSPTVNENTPTLFSWTGSLWGLFSGLHTFRFEESKTNPGGTTFVNGEEFSGPLVTLFRPFLPKDDAPNPGFIGLCEDLKKRVEEMDGKA